MRAVPLFISRDNALAVLGRSWRSVQDVAAELGVKPFRVRRVAFYDAVELTAAIRRCGTTVSDQEQPADDYVDQDELARMRSRVRSAR